MDIQSDYLVSSSVSESLLPSFAEPLPSTGSPSVRPLSLPGGPHSTQIREISQDRREEQKHVVRTQGKSGRHAQGHATTISMLPDEVLLTIFDFYRKDREYSLSKLSQWSSWKWYLLAHICHRWRQIVIASPRRLNLRILCTPRTHVKKNMSIWPTFPIAVVYHYQSETRPRDEDNILAALSHIDRVYLVKFILLGSQLEQMAAVMQEPFPGLTYLGIFSMPGDPPDLPAGFLGGSAPCLRELYLLGVSYPALPTLLLSTSDLVSLQVLHIPANGYISPEAMATSLAALPRLEEFAIGFQSTTPPYRIHSPPVTRTILPALTSFTFLGGSEYLEDLIGRIDSPRLNHISIIYMYGLVGFQVVRLSEFIDRSVGPTLTKCRHAEVSFHRGIVSFKFCLRANDPGQDWADRLLATAVISYKGINRQDTPISQVLSKLPATLDNVVHLDLWLKGDPEEFQSQAPEIEWSHLLRPFSAVRTLLVHWGLSRHVAHALEDMTDEIAAEVLPSLQLICLESGQPEAPPLDKFVAARQHSGFPVTVVNTMQEFRERLEFNQ